jgi:secreted PhoX family phosphatase
MKRKFQSDLSTRRDFLTFMGRSTLATGLLGALPGFIGCATRSSEKTSNNSSLFAKSTKIKQIPFIPLPPSNKDTLTLADGLSYKIIASWDDTINSRGERFGTNSDYIAFFSLNSSGTDGILWNNHESLHPLFVSGHDLRSPKTREQVDKERRSVGGSLIRVQRDAKDGEWRMVPNDKYNRRISGETPIELVAPRAIEGSRIAIGTLANCAGGVTPWGTVLTCEENYDAYYGETDHSSSTPRREPSRLDWEQFYDHPPEHYGWVVEVNPLTGLAKKLTALGRFAHECATVRPLADGRVVVYSGDDGENRCLYKFISNTPNSLETGTLYCADTVNGRWIPLVQKQHEALRDPKKKFRDQLDVLIRAREASQLVGGTPLARPEDVEIDPVTGAVYITLTSSLNNGRPFGSILKIEEKDNDPTATEFTSATFIAGSVESGFAFPDNMAFDHAGNLWMTSDISGSKLNKPPYEELKNNGLFYIPMRGEYAGQAFRIANAPNEAEFTGPFFSPDGRTLFLSVQHPGEETISLNKMTSHWPHGGSSMPKSAVVAITGPTLDKLLTGPSVKPLFELPVLKG